jgi:hypothetical protein
MTEATEVRKSKQLMKEGYYLSPDGKTIIELKDSTIAYKPSPTTYVKGRYKGKFYMTIINSKVCRQLFGSWKRLH